ncbi:hypothetical protein DVS28_a1470 [Euzebya pacifica]|uniref:Uncharacterized protein n=1 Tax=Euzebya pacifica TaxID=1608957 RepID=A0A346XVC1_9ACTN|nr:hypothetical protein [Euzebya pacifica]AXV06168.1 hypothetical protein DVS28_a1470 [Euzebya pacifica]
MDEIITRRLVERFATGLDEAGLGWTADDGGGTRPSTHVVFTRRPEPWIREWLVVVPFERYDHFRVELGASLGSDPDVRCPDYLVFAPGGRPSAENLDARTCDIMVDLYELFGPPDPDEVLPWGFNGIVDHDTLRAPRVAPVPPELAETQLPELVRHAIDKVVRFGEPWLSELRAATRPG